MATLFRKRRESRFAHICRRIWWLWLGEVLLGAVMATVFAAILFNSISIQ
jgi:hypothetical protein